jgi:hypothetical protein
MQGKHITATLLVAAFSTNLCVMAAEESSVRIGYVQVRDHSGRVADVAVLNEQLSARLNSAGYETVELRFQSPAAVEAAARRAGCQYILYTEVLEVRRPASDKVAAVVLKLAGSRPVEHSAEVEVQFRLFGMDEIFPRVAGSTSARGKAQGEPLVTSRVLSFSGAGASYFAPPRQSEPIEGYEDSAPRRAFDAVFDKQARMVANGVRRGPTRIDVE